MNIAVIDDSPDDRIQLINFLKKYAKDNSVLLRIFSYENGEQFLSEANFSEIDAAFLDIYMDKLNGMEVAQKIRSAGSACNIIFVTTTKDFAVKSYEVRAFNYIVKPICYQKLADVLKLLEQHCETSSRFIVVKEGRERQKVVLSEIIYSDYCNHYIQIHTQKSIISTYKKFSDFELELLKYKSFLTCYRCIMVNMDQIEKIEEDFFLMKNGEYIPINRKRSKDIKAKYIDYIFGEMEGSTDEC